MLIVILRPENDCMSVPMDLQWQSTLCTPVASTVATFDQPVVFQTSSCVSCIHKLKYFGVKLRNIEL